MTRSHVLSANDRLKGRFGDVVALSFIAATLAHFLVFQMWPEMTASDWTSPDSPDLTIIDLPTIALPAPPPPFSRPAVPVISDNVDATATIEVVDFRRMKDLPPPPPRPTEATPAERRPFVVFDVPPRLTNPEEFQRALMRAYPRSLRDAGVGGTVTLEVYVDEQGRALEGRVSDGSGYDSLDETAVSLIDVMRFRSRAESGSARRRLGAAPDRVPHAKRALVHAPRQLGQSVEPRPGCLQLAG